MIHFRQAKNYESVCHTIQRITDTPAIGNLRCFNHIQMNVLATIIRLHYNEISKCINM